jgi:IS1 family transposase
MERMTDTHRDTIMRLALRVGQGCAKIMDTEMRNLPCKRIQIDEIWAYVAKRNRQVTEKDDASRVGDFWTFVALDADTKLVPSYRVGKRNATVCYHFVRDLSERLANRVQLSSDAFSAYADAVEFNFGADVDYGQIVKAFEAAPSSPGRYSPPKIVSTSKSVITGAPHPKHISTSFIERQNLTMRMSMRRFTRLTNGFSKKPEGLRAAVALHFAHYNFCRQHKTTRVAPAMAAGITDRLWSVEELVDRTAWNWKPAPGRGRQVVLRLIATQFFAPRRDGLDAVINPH